jgi:dipeptidase E
MKLLLLSNSTNAGETFLEYADQYLKDFLANESRSLLFIPYAAVSVSFEAYEDKVKTRFNDLGFEITSIHRFNDPLKAVNEAKGIVVGGGNTFHLLYYLQRHNLLPAISRMIKNNDKPYIGWSAGSNITCPTIKTTNDMPVIEPESFNALNLISFQINPHYVDANPEGHAGETREERINEFIKVNNDVYVAGLREGCAFHIENNLIHLLGDKTVRVFKNEMSPLELGDKDNFDFLLHS